MSSERPEVIGVSTPSPTAAPGVCISSLEVFDRLSGDTRVLIPPGPPSLSNRHARIKRKA